MMESVPGYLVFLMCELSTVHRELPMRGLPVSVTSFYSIY